MDARNKLDGERVMITLETSRELIRDTDNGIATLRRLLAAMKVKREQLKIERLRSSKRRETDWKHR
jgi:hypothetical protein